MSYIRDLLFKSKPAFEPMSTFWQFKDVKDGVVIMRSGAYRMGLEVFPANFGLMDEEEKKRAVTGFEHILREIEIKYPLRVLVQTRKTNAHDYIDHLERAYGIRNLGTYDLFEKYADFIRDVNKDYEIITKKFYIVLEFSELKHTLSKDIVSREEKNPKKKRTITEEDVFQEVRQSMMGILTTFVSQLGAINLKSKILTTGDIVKVMMAYLDEDKYADNREFYEKLDDHRERAIKSGLPFSVLNKVSPDFIEEENIDLLSLNNKTYVRSEFVSELGTYAYIDWFKEIIMFPYANDLMFTFTSKDPKETVAKITGKRQRIESKIFDEKTQHKPNNIADAIVLESTEKIEKQYLRSEIKPIDLKIEAAFRSDSIQALNMVHMNFERLLHRKMMQSRIYHYEQLEGLRGAFIAGASETATRNHRDINTNVASFVFPFITPQISSNTGILYGIDEINRSLVTIDRKELESYNRSIVASTGAGKSYFIKLDLIRSRMIGYQSFVLDVENEFEMVTSYLKGKYIELSEKSVYYINPFHLSGPEYKAQKIEFVRDLFKSLYANEKISITDMTHIEKVIGAVYDRCLETDTQPVLLTFIEEIDKLPKNKTIESLLVVLRSYTEPSHPQYYLFNKQQNIDFATDDLIVFALKYVDKRDFVIAVILESYWNYINHPKNRAKFKNLIVDEASQLFQSGLIVERLASLALRGRKYNSGVTTIVQSINHYYQSGHPRTCDLFDQSSLTLVMKHKVSDSFDKLNEKVHINKPERAYLERLEIGKGLLIVNNSKIPLSIEASEEEDRVCTTRPPR
jgi:conjugal transfer ATP-binding protein TraC